MMRKILLLSLLTIAACGGSEEPAAGNNVRGVSDTEIRIGTHTDLSGPVAIWGVPTVNGIRIRFDELRAAGGVHGRNINFIVEDSQYQIPVAVKATNKLINSDEIFAMLAAMGTPHNNALFDRMFEANVPSLFPLTAAVSMFEPLHPMKYGYFVSYRDQARAGIEYLVERDGYEKLCLQTVATDYGEEAVGGFDQAIEEHGLTVTYKGSHKSSETDFVGTVTSIKNSGCEMLVLGPLIKDTILLYTALRDAGWEGVVLANMVSYLPAVSQAGTMDGLYAVASFFMPDFESDDLSDPIREWRDTYVAAYGELPAAQSTMGYVMADLLVRSLEAAGPDLTVEKMLAGLEGIDHYDSPFGGPSISFGPEKHNAADSLFLYQVTDKAWETIAENIPY